MLYGLIAKHITSYAKWLHFKNTADLTVGLLIDTTADKPLIGSRRSFDMP